VLCGLSVPIVAGAQETAATRLAQAHQALGRKDYAAYLEHALAALELKPDRLSRPFYQYSVARAYAYNGRADDAFRMLDALWNERIEGPMAFIAELDPAFVSIASRDEFTAMMRRWRDTPVVVRPLAGRVVAIDGAGANLVASIGEDGILLVDTGYPQVAPAVNAALEQRAPDKAVRFIVNTHEHYDHAGGNGFIGQQPAVLAHAAVRPAVQKPSEFTPDFSLPALDTRHLPTTTFDGTLSLRFNGEDVKIIALPAHAAGDSIVLFTTSRVLHMGDNFFPDTSTYIYPGRAPDAFFERLGPLLRDLPDETIVVSGHAAPVPLAKLKAIYGTTESAFRFVRDLRQQGRSIDDARRAGQDKGIPARWVQIFYGR
jgi:cyclase